MLLQVHLADSYDPAPFTGRRAARTREPVHCLHCPAPPTRRQVRALLKVLR